jgi:hypothetical protein
VLQCQPHEEAVMQRAIVAGREVSAMTCITPAVPAAPMYYGQPAYGQPVYGQPVYADQMVTRPVVRTVNTAPVRRVSTQSRETARRESDRSWGKTAMIIGGSTGAGAEVRRRHPCRRSHVPLVASRALELDRAHRWKGGVNPRTSADGTPW